MVKLQAPVLLAVAVPRVPPVSDTVTVEPSGAVPFKVTDLIGICRAAADDRSGRGWRSSSSPLAVNEILSRSHWLGAFAAENSSVVDAAGGSHGVGIFCIAKLRRVGERKQRLPVPYRLEVVPVDPSFCSQKLSV